MRRALLGFTTMADEDDFTAALHKEVIEDILKVLFS